MLKAVSELTARAKGDKQVLRARARLGLGLGLG